MLRSALGSTSGGLEETDRVLVVADLRPGIQVLAILAVRHPEVAIVEDQSVDAGGGSSA